MTADDSAARCTKCSCCGYIFLLFQLKYLATDNTTHGNPVYTNDVDYRLARLLADQVITEKPFMEISGETFQKALKAMESCDRVICTSVPVGSCNKRLGELIEAAKKSRKVQFV